VPAELLRELAPGGRLVAPVGESPGDQVLTVCVRSGDRFEHQAGIRCRFVPLVAGEETGADDESRGKVVRAVELRVHGTVQGVFYRASAQREARRLGLAGWVRNMSDGTVCVRVQGPTAAVDALLAWCRVGPPGAEVTGLDVSDVDPDPALAGFLTR